jgi:hypothetical protein
MSAEHLIDPIVVRKFVALLHQYAASALSGIPNPGVMQLSTLTPGARRMRTQAFSVGDIAGMTEAALVASRGGANVFVEGRTVRAGRPGERGRAERTVAVFSFTIDRDSDKNRAGHAINGDATITVQTSEHNTQQWIVLERAVDIAVAGPLGGLIRESVRADVCTGNVVQPFRLPGLPNIPDQKKISRGRTTVATKLLHVTGTLWTPEKITAAFAINETQAAKPAHALKRNGPTRSTPRLVAAVKRKLAAKVTADTDRSSAFQSAIHSAQIKRSASLN